MEIRVTWDRFKEILASTHLGYECVPADDDCNVYTVDGNIMYSCFIEKDSAEETDFTTNYAANANQGIEVRNVEGKLSSVASSRPRGTKTTFTMRGDHATNGIGEGTIMEWDMASITAADGRKKKTIDVTFNEEIWIKEGCVYFHNTNKGTFCNMSVVCPAGGYVIVNGNPVQVPVDTVVSRYVIHHFIQGDCPMGDELNTEEAQENALPIGYIVRLEVDGPEADTDGNGYVSFELYRKNTI